MLTRAVFLYKLGKVSRALDLGRTAVPSGTTDKEILNIFRKVVARTSNKK